MSTVKITQNPEQPIATEVIAESILRISSGLRKMLSGSLNQKALLLLISEATPTVNGKAVGQKVVLAVLQGIQSLEKTYLKPKGK